MSLLAKSNSSVGHSCAKSVSRPVSCRWMILLNPLRCPARTCGRAGGTHLSRVLHTLSRRLVATPAQKGFGEPRTAAPKQAAAKRTGAAKTKRKKADTAVTPVDGTSQKAVQRAVRAAEGGAVRPVSAAEAAKGRVDYVQVKDWGSGNPDDLEELEVESVTSGHPPEDDVPQPFYVELARRLEQLQASGALNVAQPERQRLPPFEAWSFREMRYLQFLADQLEAHSALEACLTVATSLPYDTNHPASAEAQESVAEEAGVAAALDHFGPEAGFARAETIITDLDHLAKASSMSEPFALDPGQQAVAYGQYLSGLAMDYLEDETSWQEKQQAGLRLLANIYALHVSHLTTGTRIGATAAEKLNLFPILATNFYQTYPDHVRNPLHLFVQTMNAAGVALSEEEREEVMQELPKAFQKCSLLLSALAHED